MCLFSKTILILNILHFPHTTCTFSHLFSNYTKRLIILQLYCLKARIIPVAGARCWTSTVKLSDGGRLKTITQQFTLSHGLHDESVATSSPVPVPCRSYDWFPIVEWGRSGGGGEGETSVSVHRWCSDGSVDVSDSSDTTTVTVI